MTIKNAAAVGQATNLAAADARKNNRESDVRYIYQRYVFWEVVCQSIQSNNVKMIQDAIDCEEFDELMKRFEELLGEKK